MSRTKGAKNRPKSEAELLLMLAEAKAAGDNEAPEERSPTIENKAPKIEKPTKSIVEFTLKTPDGEPENDASGLADMVLRCGNPKCGKILPNEVNKCPFCGVNLKWD